MEFSNIRLDLRPPLAHIVLDRPRVLNALSADSFAELDRALDMVADDAAIRVILLSGAGGRAFAAGTDIPELAEAASADAGRAISLRGQHVLRRIETVGKPVIACIQGFALGGGCELAMACTFRIAAEDARLGQPEAKLGVTPGYGGTQRLPRLVGRGAALKLLLTGEIIGAAEALRIGLVDDVVPAADLMSRTETLALAIAANAPLAITEILQTVDEGLGLPLELALLREADAFGRLCATSDQADGLRAFLEKRAPKWNGN
jgi:enoyl-CoA hydratase